MAQLKMYWLRQTPYEAPLPEGFTIKLYTSPQEKQIWADLCKNGLVRDDADEAEFDKTIIRKEHCVPEKDLFFLLKDGEYAATVAAIYNPEEGDGDIHMVSVATAYRGLGLGNCLTSIALKKLYQDGCTYVHLTTDEFRKAAVKSYVRAGFLPVQYDAGMPERWLAVMKDLDIPRLDMLNDDRSFFRTLIKEEQ